LADLRWLPVRFGLGFLRVLLLRIDVPGKGVLVDDAIDVVKFAAAF
jgi:hypothetical protein